MKFIYLIVALMSFTPKSFACSMEEYSRERNFELADDVLRVKVLSTTLVVVNRAEKYQMDRERVEANYEVIEVFKGSALPPKFRSPVYKSNMCLDIGILSGNEYIVFLKGNERNVQSSSADGSHMFFEETGTKELEELRALSKKNKSGK